LRRVVLGRVKMLIKNQKEIKKFYEDEEVIAHYFKERFESPVGRVLHRNQVEFINKIIKKYGIKTILEIAPGPARLTTEIESKGYILDSSERMLEIARKRLSERKLSHRWRLIKADAFSSGLRENFTQMVITMRFIRHFKLKDREKLYAEIKRLLKPGGLLIFDVPNYTIESILRKGKSEKEYPIYDKLWKKDEFIAEMEKNGFDVLEMEGNLKIYPVQAIISKINKVGLSNLAEKIIYAIDRWRLSRLVDLSLEWLVLCRKR